MNSPNHKILWYLPHVDAPPVINLFVDYFLSVNTCVKLWSELNCQPSFHCRSDDPDDRSAYQLFDRSTNKILLLTLFLKLLKFYKSTSGLSYQLSHTEVLPAEWPHHRFEPYQQQNELPLPSLFDHRRYLLPKKAVKEMQRVYHIKWW